MSKTYELVTERITAMLEQGTIPWRQPWSTQAGLADQQNLMSGHQYRGINAMLTSASGYTDPYWLTYRQAQEIGAQVRKGERGTPIVFWKMGVGTDADPEKRWAFASHSTVFNVAQCEGEGLEKLITRIRERRQGERINFKPIEACEAIVAGYKGPAIQHHEQSAWYMPVTDLINMPRPETFTRPEAYYAVLFHEMAHSTGHASRLARSGITDRAAFASHEYSKEELIAEMGSAFLCSRAGIDAPVIENTAAYLQSWLKVLKADPKMLMQAASAGQKAADMILGQQAATEQKSA